MGFKDRPSRLVVADTAVANLPRRLAGRPLIDPRTADPEICQQPSRGMILSAFHSAFDNALKISLLGGACATLGQCLDQKSRTTNVPGRGEEPNDVYVICAHCIPGGRETGSSSSVSASSMQLCLSAYGTGLSQSLVNGVVLRELIRLCGGTELDAWALYYYCESTVDLAGNRWFPTLPAMVKDWMCIGSAPLSGPGGTLSWIRVGTFVVWYTNFGQLYPRGIGAAVSAIGSSLTGSSNSNWARVCP
jgi:hypothetical protein